MKKCELCNSLARMYCESDQASLCWDCDAKVHAANFLVAKHSRTLLCHLCQSLTPWNASGPKLTPTVSVCNSCANRSNCREDRCNNEGDRRRDDDDDDLDRDDDGADRDDSEDSENGDGGDEDDEDNQVVPWSSSTAPPPPASSSSNSDDHESSSVIMCSGNEPDVYGSKIAFYLKRSRDSAQDDLCCLLSQRNSCVAFSRPLKEQKTSSTESQQGLKKAEIPEIGNSTMIFDICKLK